MENVYGLMAGVSPGLEEPSINVALCDQCGALLCGEEEEDAGTCAICMDGIGFEPTEAGYALLDVLPVNSADFSRYSLAFIHAEELSAAQPDKRVIIRHPENETICLLAGRVQPTVRENKR